jgi:hypothetical protein
LEEGEVGGGGGWRRGRLEEEEEVGGGGGWRRMVKILGTLRVDRARISCA